MKRSKRTLLSLAAALALTGAILFLTRPPRSVNDEARRITSGRNSSIDYFVWLDDHEVVYSEYGNPALVRWNTRTRTQSAFPVPKELASFVGTKQFWIQRPWLLSPNGKSLLWLVDPLKRAMVQEIASGSVSASLPFTPNYYSDHVGPLDLCCSGEEYDDYRRSGFTTHLLCQWLPDSQGIVQFIYPNADDNVALQTRRFAPTVGQDTQRLVLPDHALPHALEILGRDAEGKTVALARINAYDATRFVLFDPRDARTAAREVTFPKGGKIAGWALSAEGDRILWTRYQRAGSRWPHWIPDWISRFRPRTEELTHFYTSRVDGSDLHEIGCYKGEYSESYLEPPQWVPGGKAISYLWNGSLYTFPVP